MTKGKDCIKVQQDRNITINNSYVVGNGNSRCIHLEEKASLDFHQSTLVHCNATSHGGAIMASKSNTVSLDCSNFINNAAKINGGAIFGDETRLNVTNCRFFNNNAGFSRIGFGGALRINSGQLYFNKCELRDNKAKSSGGGLFVKKSTIYINNSDVSYNSARYGGGVYADSNCKITFHNTTVTSNEIRDGDVGGLYIDRLNNEVDISDSIIHNNTGGGIAMHNTTFTILNTDITNNTGQFNIGGIYLNKCLANNRIINSRIMSNKADQGGGINLSNSYLQLYSTMIKWNDAVNGGNGIYCGIGLIEVSKITLNNMTVIDDQFIHPDGKGCSITFN